MSETPNIMEDYIRKLIKEEMNKQADLLEVTLKEEKLQYENLKRTISREVKDIVRSVAVAREQLVINEKNQKVAERSYEISHMRFENGDITSQELVVEQERLAESQLQYLNAFITYQLSVNDLKRKTLWDFKNTKIYLIDTSDWEN